MAPKAKVAAKKAIAKRLPRRIGATRQELSQARSRHNGFGTGAAENSSAKSAPPDTTVPKTKDSSGPQKIIDCFSQFDVNGDGKITTDELKAVFTHLKVSSVDVDSFMKLVDTNEDGVLDYAEFSVWLYGENELANHVLDQCLAFTAELTAAKEQLELAQLRHHHAERDAEKPKLVEVWFEKDDSLGLQFGRGDEKLSNTVTKASPGDAAYAKGVREGWRVLQVGDVAVKETSYVPDLIMEVRLTGPALVKFLPADVEEKQRVAEASLEGLRAAVERCRAILEELQRPLVVVEGSEEMAEKMKEGPPPEPNPEDIGVPPPWVRVQYYDYREAFHAPEGNLAATAIDEVYGLSDAMPKCQIMLAEWRRGNTHILDYDDVDSGASPLVKEEGGIFRGLEAECLYFLLVQEDAGLRKTEIAARRKQRETERLEDVRRETPHDCEKEQVFGSLQVAEATQHPWVNGQYYFCGNKGPRPKFINSVMQPNTGRSIMEFETTWRIIMSEDDFIPQPSLYTPAGDGSGLLPPTGYWPSCTDLTNAKISVSRTKVCRICDPRSTGVGAPGEGVSFLGL